MRPRPCSTDAGLTDDPDARVGLEHLRDPAPDELVVVDEEDGDRVGHGDSLSVR